MAVTPVNLTRVSFTQRYYNLRESMLTNSVGLYHVQNQLTTGLRFVRPSEDPLRASAAFDLDRRMERLDQAKTNLRTANAVLTEVESATQEAIDLFDEARSLAIQVVGDSTSHDEQIALTDVVDSILDQLVAIGNRQYLNTYLFAGHQNKPPFALTGEGVIYTGDANRMEAIVDTELGTDHYTVPGVEFFGATTAEVQGFVDLDPALTKSTRVGDLRGTTGQGVELGRIEVRRGNDVAQIDLSGAATVGDIIDKLNAELPGGMTAVMGVRGISLTQAGVENVTIAEIGGGHTARDLGLLGSFNLAVKPEEDLDPQVTPFTTIDALRAGAGMNLNTPIVVQNGSKSATIDLSSAKTVEDVLNAFNYADVGVWARIGSDGASLSVVSRLSGTDMTIAEDGGQSATLLGLRSLHGGTTLAALNDGEGVQTVSGNDLRITTANNTVIDVDLDGALTLQDVINRINAAGGGAVAATLKAQGNGLLIRDQTVGGGAFGIEPLGDSPAVRGLGLDAPATGNELIGKDVNPLRSDSPFTALLELREGMLRDDRNLMMDAGERIEEVLKNMQRVQGQIAAQAGQMADREERVETEVLATQVLQSDVRDVDFTEAVIRYQQLQNALQANLTTASKTMNLSLLDYLR